VALRDSYDVAFANDTDADRHGIVCPSAGLMQPNEFLVAAIDYLCRNRPDWTGGGAIGKTAVSSAMIDRVTARLGRKLFEVPVGFKWFSTGLMDGSLVFGGEESAGASFLRRDGTVWTTDKDGLIMGLLAAEITARTGMDPGRYHAQATAGLGRSHYARTDAPASQEQRAKLAKLSPEAVTATSLGDEPVLAALDRAPGNDEPIGGIKIVAHDGWFAARPSGTENIYKIYAESFRDAAHLGQIEGEAHALIDHLFGQA
jgi:phosphoglucomutase